MLQFAELSIEPAIQPHNQAMWDEFTKPKFEGGNVQRAE